MINFTKKEYKKLMSTAIKANDGTLFLNPQNPQKRIKIFLEFPNIPEYLSIKMHTTKRLIENQDLLKELRIAFPEEIVSIDHYQRGFQCNNIPGNLLEDILDDPNVPLEFKIDCFKQIGTLLRKMAHIRKTTDLKKLFYNDMHEGNFIVNPQGIVYGIDPDSFSIADNVPSSGYYSSELVDILPHNRRKYPNCELVCDYASEIVPDENLDLYCYIRMILNFMYGKEIKMITPDKFLDYLDYLEFRGGNLDFLDTLARIYDDETDNLNPDYLLDHIKDIYKDANIRYDTTGTLRRILKKT